MLYILTGAASYTAIPPVWWTGLQTEKLESGESKTVCNSEENKYNSGLKLSFLKEDHNFSPCDRVIDWLSIRDWVEQTLKCLNKTAGDGSVFVPAWTVSGLYEYKDLFCGSSCRHVDIVKASRVSKTP